MDRQDIMIASLQEGSSQRVFNTRNMERHATIYMNELVDENEDEKAEDFDHILFGQGGRFRQCRNNDDEGF